MTRRAAVALFLLTLVAACSSPPTSKGENNVVIITNNTNNDTTQNNVMITQCGPGRTLCDGGCIDTSLDSQNCGSCGQTCGAGTVCSESQCQPVPTDCRTEGMCPAHYFCDEGTGLCEVGCTTNADCPTGSYCELESHACLCSEAGSVVCGTECVAESPLSCGATCETCAPISNGAALCTDGACVQQCNDGYMMCDGKCSACPGGAGVVSVACLGDRCVASECEAGHEICDGTCATCPATTGTESLGCDGATCIITDCPADTKLCNGTCADCPSDPNGSTTCQGDACVLLCSGGYHACGDYCAVDGDATACGPSCTYCPDDNNGSAVCAGGACALQCDSDYRECQSACAACPNGPGVVSTMCAGASCVVSSCAAGYQPCAGGCCQAAPDGVAFDASSVLSDVTMDLDSRGYPHIATGSATGNDVYYVWWDGSAWQNEYVTSGWAASIKLDLMDRPHIAIWKRNPDGAWYASRDPATGWTVEEVDTTFNDVGMTPNLQMAGNTPHIAYYDLQANNLRYAVKNGNSWTDNLVVSTDEVGFSPTMVLVGGEVHIVCRDETNDRTRHSWNDGTWHTTTVDELRDSGNYSSLAADSQGDLHLAYVAWSSLNGEQIYYNGRMGDFWGTEGYIADGDRPSLVIDAADLPIITYYDPGGTGLYYASYSNGWTPTPLDASSSVGESNDAVYDPATGKVHVAYSDYTNRDVKYLTFSP